MQLLLIHSDYIEFEAKRPTPVAEKVEEAEKSGRLEEALCAFIAVEKWDEDDLKLLPMMVRSYKSEVRINGR